MDSIFSQVKRRASRRNIVTNINKIDLKQKGRYIKAKRCGLMTL